MSDIFKILYQDVTNAKRFGICDEKNKQRAFIKTDNGSEWMAVVENNSRKEVTFTALDNCIELRKPNDKMESRCEGAITYDNTIIFLEIKEQIGDAKTWAKDADRQLRASIDTIQSRINLNQFAVKKAVIANSLKRSSKEKHTVRMKKFEEDTGYILTVDKRINID